MPRHAYGRWALLNGLGRRLDAHKAADVGVAIDGDDNFEHNVTD